MTRRSCFDSRTTCGVTSDNAEFATDRKVCKGFAISDMGALVAESEAERFESTVDNGNDNVHKELGRGKRQKHPNWLYCNLYNTSVTPLFGAMMTKGIPTNIEYFTA